jgi:hypothetical protein
VLPAALLPKPHVRAPLLPLSAALLPKPHLRAPLLPLSAALLPKPHVPAPTVAVLHPKPRGDAETNDLPADLAGTLLPVPHLSPSDANVLLAVQRAGIRDELRDKAHVLDSSGDVAAARS